MKKLILISVIFTVFTASAQELYFSQFASSPLTLNPANTGLLQGDFRMVANYGNEWNSVTVPNITTSFSYDMNLFKGKSKKGFVGLGIIRLDRVAGDMNELSSQTGISLAYHRKLNSNKKLPSTLSIGLQSSMVQKSGEMQFIYFGTPSYIEIKEYELDPYLDYNIGLMYTGYLSQRFSIHGGLSYFHFTQPFESILGDDYRIQSTFSTSIGGAYTISKRLRSFFSTVYQQQGKAYEFSLGGALGYNLSPNQALERKQVVAYLGSWYKYNDAIVPYVGLDWNGFRLGFSSDLTVSALTEATKGRTVFELSLIYNGLFGSNRTFNSNLAVPRF